MIDIQIYLDKSNRFKKILHKLHSKAENLMFSIVRLLPEKLTPQPLVDWTGKYVEKQISKTKQQLIRSRWETVALDELSEKIDRQH